MDGDVLFLILQVERNYQAAVGSAVKEAGNYTDGRKQEQRAYTDGLKREWERFERVQTNKLHKLLSEAEQETEKKTAQMKSRLKDRQREKAEQISERLKQEVISFYGNR